MMMGSVMPGLEPGIHVLPSIKAWMAGTSPAMTHCESGRGCPPYDVCEERA